MTRRDSAAPAEAPLTSAPASEQRPAASQAIAYFTDPTPEALALEVETAAAYDEARALYGDEDGDAWLAALEDGTHPLCRIKTAASSS